ncbi:hypothetical protein C2857_006837 [Epichloe festucae Fl1]|uniref:Uncharacterized protein n=1 Tax=Epichloe festucae (strain Fl1) TaxID=877507 RepID=A0A7S9KU35_EPIFF|nr:hypothetical protein C2857_006837 [Epichloe festucae Fl1]
MPCDKNRTIPWAAVFLQQPLAEEKPVPAECDNSTTNSTKCAHCARNNKGCIRCPARIAKLYKKLYKYINANPEDRCYYINEYGPLPVLPHYLDQNQPEDVTLTVTPRSALRIYTTLQGWGYNNQRQQVLRLSDALLRSDIPVNQPLDDEDEPQIGDEIDYSKWTIVDDPTIEAFGPAYGVKLVSFIDYILGLL